MKSLRLSAQTKDILFSELSTGDHRVLRVKDIVKLYRDEVNQSLPSHGKIQRIGDDSFSLTGRFKTIDCDNLEAVHTFKVYSLSTKTAGDGVRTINSVRCISAAHEVAEIASAISENGRYMARLRAPSSSAHNGDGFKKQILEIWDHNRLLKTFDTSELDAHGLINADPHFSNFVWSPFENQDKLLYVSQPKKLKNLSFFKEPKQEPNHVAGDDVQKPDIQKAESSPTRGEEFSRKEDWGECLGGIEHTIVAIMDVSNNFQITTIDLDEHSLSSPQWFDNGNKIVSVAYKETPRKLGIIYCNNRPSMVVVHDWQAAEEGPIVKLEDAGQCYHTPRVNHVGDKFIYLSNAAFGPHIHAVKLHTYDIRTRSTETFVDVSDKELELFIRDGGVPRSCFASNDKQVLLVTHDHLYQYLCLYSLDTRKLTKIKFPSIGISVLDFQHDIILASGSEINATPTLFVASINLLNVDDVVAWHQIEDYVHLDEVEYEPHEIPTEDKTSFVSAVLVKPNLSVLREFPGSSGNVLVQQNQLPTVVIVHGGPHATFSVEYNSTVALFARLGLRTLLINYRGSTGVSQEYSQSLCGRAGQLDVNDCLYVIRYFVQNGVIDPKKLVIQGGSHGGFLACHLSCQQEFKFTSAIIRNPVVDISQMHSTTDIPDWAYTVALGHSEYDFSWVPGSHDLAKMYESSPMSKCQQANVPTLMLLGDKDQRVKMFQGERWVDNLKARGIETLCKVYPDKHDLAKPDVAANAAITQIIWILSHLPK